MNYKLVGGVVLVALFVGLGLVVVLEMSGFRVKEAAAATAIVAGYAATSAASARMKVKAAIEASQSARNLVPEKVEEAEAKMESTADAVKALSLAEKVELANRGGM